jgi:hypothetical protein
MFCEHDLLCFRLTVHSISEERHMIRHLSASFSVTLRPSRYSHFPDRRSWGMSVVSYHSGCQVKSNAGFYDLAFPTASRKCRKTLKSLF